MRRLLILAALALPLWGACPDATNGYSYCRTVTVDPTYVSGASPLTDFTITVRGTLSYLAVTGSGGKVEYPSSTYLDIRFQDGGTTQLKHEVEKWVSTTGEFVAHVKIPSLSNSVDTVIYMYYGNAALAAHEYDAINTWNSGYVIVLHLSEDPSGGAPQMLDSTTNSLDGTSGGTMLTADQVAAHIDGGLEFDGTDDTILIGEVVALDSDNTFTVSFWAQRSTYGADNVALSIRQSTGSGNFFGIYPYDSSGGNGARVYYAGTLIDDNSGALAGASFHHFTFVSRSATDHELFADGTSVGTSATSKSLWDISNVNVGSWHSTTQSYAGKIDGVRISNVTRSDGWIVTEYNAGDPATFYAIGAEDTTGGATPPPRSPMIMRNLAPVTFPVMLGGAMVLLTLAPFEIEIEVAPVEPPDPPTPASRITVEAGVFPGSNADLINKDIIYRRTHPHPTHVKD